VREGSLGCYTLMLPTGPISGELPRLQELSVGGSKKTPAALHREFF
jgi:hypothetical protein